MKVLYFVAILFLALSEGECVGKRRVKKIPANNNRRSLSGVQGLSHLQSVEQSFGHSAFAHQQHAQLVAKHQQERLAKLTFAGAPAPAAAPVAAAAPAHVSQSSQFLVQNHHHHLKAPVLAAQEVKYAPSAGPKYLLQQQQPLFQAAAALNQYATGNTVRLVAQNQPSTYAVPAFATASSNEALRSQLGVNSVTAQVSPVIDKPTAYAAVPGAPAAFAYAPGANYVTYATPGGLVGPVAATAVQGPRAATGSQAITSYASSLAGAQPQRSLGGQVSQTTQSVQIEHQPAAVQSYPPTYAVAAPQLQSYQAVAQPQLQQYQAVAQPQVQYQAVAQPQVQQYQAVPQPQVQQYQAVAQPQQYQAVAQPQLQQYQAVAQPQVQYQAVAQPQPQPQVQYQAVARPQVQQYQAAAQPQVQQYQAVAQPQVQQYQAVAQPQVQQYQAVAQPQVQQYQAVAQPQVQQYQPVAQPQAQSYQAPAEALAQVQNYQPRNSYGAPGLALQQQPNSVSPASKVESPYYSIQQQAETSQNLFSVDGNAIELQDIQVQASGITRSKPFSTNPLTQLESTIGKDSSSLGSAFSELTRDAQTGYAGLQIR